MPSYYQTRQLQNAGILPTNRVGRDEGKVAGNILLALLLVGGFAAYKLLHPSTDFRVPLRTKKDQDGKPIVEEEYDVTSPHLDGIEHLKNGELNLHHHGSCTTKVSVGEGGKLKTETKGGEGCTAKIIYTKPNKTFSETPKAVLDKEWCNRESNNAFKNKGKGHGGKCSSAASTGVAAGAASQSPLATQDIRALAEPAPTRRDDSDIENRQSIINLPPEPPKTDSKVSRKYAKRQTEHAHNMTPKNQFDVGKGTCPSNRGR